jgi:hypothetical protein
MVERNRERRWGLRFFVGLLIMAGLVWVPSFAGATTTLAEDVEVQAWYRVRNTFQTDGKEHFDWVQWRNEAFIWLTYDNMVQDGKLKALGDLSIPFVENAGVSARYRIRVDPVYYLREHYRNIYDENNQSDFFEPENGFRDLYIDMKHGQIGPGRLSTRWGYQQIVWGESDLFRSLDIINPLRIDQNFPIGEKFDEFRLPILATKFLYEIGNMGTWLSDTAIEAFYTPRYRNGLTHLIDEQQGARIPFQERGCLGANGQLLDYTPENCAHATHFLPYRPWWLGNRRVQNPWSLSRGGNNSRIDAADYYCVTQRCAPDVPGDRGTLIVNLPTGGFHKHSRGTNPDLWNAGGVRFLAKTGIGVDFSLNYLFLPVLFANSNPANHPPDVYGDGIPGAVGTFQEGLLRCLSPSGKQGVGRNGQTNDKTFVALVGADLGGYNWPERRLDAKGNPLPTAKQKQATRSSTTLCSNGFNYQHNFTHVIGFTATYNDFDYTGAVFRLEESLSTREKVDKKAIGWANNFAPSPQVVANRARINNRLLLSTPVWRSMVGFDLVSALGNYGPFAWTRRLPGGIGTQQSFFTFQWLTQYVFEGITNNMCNWNFAMGIGPSQPSEGNPVRPAIRGCTTKHWNNFFTFAWAGNGFFNGKLEQRMAVALEPRGKQWLLYGQWWWRGFMDTPVDLSFGTSWFPSSRMDNSWTLLNYFVHRNLLWVEGTYYIL